MIREKKLSLKGSFPASEKQLYLMFSFYAFTSAAKGRCITLYFVLFIASISADKEKLVLLVMFY